MKPQTKEEIKSFLNNVGIKTALVWDDDRQSEGRYRVKTRLDLHLIITNLTDKLKQYAMYGLESQRTNGIEITFHDGHIVYANFTIRIAIDGVKAGGLMYFVYYGANKEDNGDFVDFMKELFDNSVLVVD